MRPTLILASLFCLAAPAQAQSLAHWLEPGTRVRVTTPTLLPRQVTGDVAATLTDTLVLDRGDRARLAIPNLRIDLIEVSRGHDRRRGGWRGALLGALLGAGLGGTFGALSSRDLPTDIGTSAGLGFLGGGLLGGGIGAGVGAMTAPESWQAYRIEHSAASTASPATPPSRATTTGRRSRP